MSEFQRIPSCPTCGKPLPCILHDRRTREALLAPEIERPTMELLRSGERNGEQRGEIVARPVRDGKTFVYSVGSEGAALLDLKTGESEGLIKMGIAPSELGAIALPTGGFVMFGHDAANGRPAFLLVDAFGRPSRRVLEAFASKLEVEKSKASAPSERILDRMDEIVGTSSGRGLAFVIDFHVVENEEEGPSEYRGKSQRIFAVDAESGEVVAKEIGAIQRDPIDKAYALPDGRLVTKSSGEICVLEVRPDGTVAMDPILLRKDEERFLLKQLSPTDWVCLSFNKYGNSILSRHHVVYANGRIAVREMQNEDLDDVHSLTPLDGTRSVGLRHHALVEVDVAADPPSVRTIAPSRADVWMQDIASLGNGQVMIRSRERLGRRQFNELWGVPEDKLRAYHESMVAADADEEIPELPFV